MALVVVLSAGCGADEDAGPERSPSATQVEDVDRTDGDLPPVDVAAIAPLYEDALADMGLRLTDRGGLIDTDGYEQSAEGTHLALYAEPVGARTAEQYLAGLVEVTALFAADVFDRWPGLESFDICQERAEDADDDEYPQLTVTQVDLTREAAAGVDWDGAQLVDVLVAGSIDEDSAVRAFPPVSTDEQWRLAVAEADEQTEGSGWRRGG